MEEFTFDTPQYCLYCDDVCNSEAIVLQCGHLCHNKCINAMIHKEFPEHVDMWNMDKNKIYELKKQDRNKYHTMVLGEDNNGIIKCSKCNTEYTIFSPIYRELGYPKKIIQKVYFNIDIKNEPVYRYDICTLMDIIHLLEKPTQKLMLDIINYDDEYQHVDKCRNGYVFYNLEALSDDFCLHAILYYNTLVIYESKETCKACKVGNTNDFKHASIEDFIKFCTLDPKSNKKKPFT